MKILKKLLKFIIYLASIISLIIIGGNINYCSNKNKEKTQERRVKKAVNYSEEWTKYYSLEFGLLAEDYKYIAVNLSNGEVVALNDDYTFSEIIQQSTGNYSTTEFIRSIPTILENRGETQNLTINYLEFMMQYYFTGPFSNEGVSTEVSYNFLLSNREQDIYIVDSDIPFTDYQGDGQANNIQSANINTNGNIFNSNYDQIFLVFTTNYSSGFYPGYMEFFINYSSFYVETDNSEYINLYNDFLDLKYEEEYSEIIGQLQADNQGLQEENRNLFNQNQILKQENETLEQNYNQAYNQGLADGQKQAFGIINFLERILLMLDNILNIEILPFIKLWYIVAIPLILGVVKMVLSWFR